MYYVDGFGQKEVAKRLGVSRPTVSRLLQRARDLNIVNISIQGSLSSCLETERLLCSVGGLAEAVVVPTPESDDGLKAALAHGAAWYLDTHIDEIRTLAVGWGSTVSLIPSFVRKRKSRRLRCVTEVFGSLTSGPSAYQPLRLAMALSALYGVETVGIPAPAIVFDSRVREVLLGDRQIRQALDLAFEADLMLVSVGTADETSTMVSTGFLTTADVVRLHRLGAVGDILARYYDVQGRHIESPFEGRVVGLTLEELAGLRGVMAVAGGQGKLDSIVGAVRGGFIQKLVTDEQTGRAVVHALRAAAAGASAPHGPRPSLA